MGQTTVPTAHTALDEFPSSTRDVSSFGVSVFLASDIMLFAPFFAAYFALRSTTHPWPPEGVELDVARALAATAALVASSFTLVAAERAERGGDHRRHHLWLITTIALGAAFLLNQVAEYATLSFSAGDHTYGSVYWLLTGLHGAHVTVGLIALSLLLVRALARPAAGTPTPLSGSNLTTGVSLFWHLVDVVWIGVFLTIWVVR